MHFMHRCRIETLGIFGGSLVADVAKRPRYVVDALGRKPLQHFECCSPEDGCCKRPMILRSRPLRDAKLGIRPRRGEVALWITS